VESMTWSIRGNPKGIDFQMGRARLAARGTTRKSTALARPEARSIVPSASPARQPFSAWAATSARWAGPKHGPIGGARKWPGLRHGIGLACQQPARNPYYFQYINYSLHPLTLKFSPAPSHLPRAATYLASAPPGPVISPPATRSHTATLPSPPPLSASRVPLPPAPPPPPRLPLSSGARRGPAAEVALPATDSRRPGGGCRAPMVDLTAAWKRRSLSLWRSSPQPGGGGCPPKLPSLDS
jgi:hypothetical protein